MNRRSAHLPTPSPSPNLYPVTTSPVRRRSTCSQYGKPNHILPPPPPSPPALCLSYSSSHPSVQPSEAPNTSSVKQTSTTSKKSTRTQRKINHSIIEKRRRVRINDCLEALRSLVPGWDELKTLGAGAREGEDEDGWAGEGKGAGKEFKLEVLMRTVAYVRHLQDSITKLEANHPISKPVDPDETEEELEEDNEDDEEEDEDEDDEEDVVSENVSIEKEEKPAVSTQNPTNPDPIPARSSSLPSISSLTSLPSASRSSYSFASPNQPLSHSHFFLPHPHTSSSSPYSSRPNSVSLSPRSRWNSVYLPPVIKPENSPSPLTDTPSHQPVHAYSRPNLSSSTDHGSASSTGLGLYTKPTKVEDHENRGLKRKRTEATEEVEAASALLSFSNVRST